VPELIPSAGLTDLFCYSRSRSFFVIMLCSVIKCPWFGKFYSGGICRVLLLLDKIFFTYITATMMCVSFYFVTSG